MTAEASSKMAPTPTVAKKNMPKKSSSDNSKPSTPTSQVSRLGKLPGLSITKFGGKVVGAEGKSQNISAASKSSMGDLSHQLENQLRKSKTKDDKEEPAPPLPQEAGGRGVIPKNRKSVVSAPQIKPTLPKSVSISSSVNKVSKPSSNRSKAQPPVKTREETPAKTVSVSGPPEADNSPVMQRKRLLELIAAERAEEEKRRKLKKARTEQKSNSNVQQSGTQKQQQQQTQISSEKNSKDKPESQRVIKKENAEVPTETSQDVAQKIQQTKTPQIETPTNVKLEKVETLSENVIAPSSGPKPVEKAASSSSDSFQADLDRAVKGVVITPTQFEILNRQFQVKDYLSRKEMRSLAKQTGLTDVQVRDWFKQKRFDDDVPTIIEERPSELQLNLHYFQVKEEPVEVNDYGFGISKSIPPVDNLPAQSDVKKEPVEDENEPDSAVLDPTTGKLFKQRAVDKDMEQILLKAPVLESLAKKIEETT